MSLPRRSVTIRGNAVPTTVWSRAARNKPRSTATTIWALVRESTKTGAPLETACVIGSFSCQGGLKIEQHPRPRNSLGAMQCVIANGTGWRLADRGAELLPHRSIEFRDPLNVLPTATPTEESTS